jgi:hypothetical protein
LSTRKPCGRLNAWIRDGKTYGANFVIGRKSHELGEQDRPFDPDVIVASIERYAIRLDQSSAVAQGSGGISAAEWTWSNE